MSTFTEVLNRHLEKLELYVPVVARVHGDAHPEFHAVAEIFQSLKEKVKKRNTLELYEDFEKLRQITNDFALPADVCETYEAVYEMLAELNQALLAG